MSESYSKNCVVKCQNLRKLHTFKTSETTTIRKIGGREENPKSAQCLQTLCLTNPVPKSLCPAIEILTSWKDRGCFEACQKVSDESRYGVPLVCDASENCAGRQFEFVGSTVCAKCFAAFWSGPGNWRGSIETRDLREVNQHLDLVPISQTSWNPKLVVQS